MNTTSIKAPAPVSVVTGAAGGIGAAICKAFADAGFIVVAGYRSSAGPAQALVDSLGGVAGHVAMQVDVADSASLAKLSQAVAGRFGRCDVLVNCAGTTGFIPHADLEGLGDELIDAILMTNVRGPFAAVRAFRPLLAQSGQPGGGVVVNLSSIAARTAMGSNVMYCASKAALDNITASLARALSPSIRVLSVSPGLVDTSFVKGLDASWRDEQAQRTPLQRLAAPAEVAHAVVAASVALTFSTGCVIPVDGGRPLG
ncbi:SDR family NAD(P)-dependent oxidoreductase [Paraburkholderia tropica]|uniref:SDR family NAD(P)-dependent oxidoreductase n=1 Tax=Paraburkholderia tropica TaxID=92647 RepID=UPI002AB7A708|nr:SDR family oxidoreductase [Paraburkholderia tropica]